MLLLNLDIFKAYSQLLFPTVPDGYSGSEQEQRTHQKVVRQLSVGNGSAVLGLVTTKKARSAKREAVLSAYPQ